MLSKGGEGEGGAWDLSKEGEGGAWDRGSECITRRWCRAINKDMKWLGLICLSVCTWIPTESGKQAFKLLLEVYTLETLNADAWG